MTAARSFLSHSKSLSVSPFLAYFLASFWPHLPSLRAPMSPPMVTLAPHTGKLTEDVAEFVHSWQEQAPNQPPGPTTSSLPRPPCLQQSLGAMQVRTLGRMPSLLPLNLHPGCRGPGYLCPLHLPSSLHLLFLSLEPKLGFHVGPAKSEGCAGPASSQLCLLALAPGCVQQV